MTSTDEQRARSSRQLWIGIVLGGAAVLLIGIAWRLFPRTSAPERTGGEGASSSEAVVVDARGLAPMDEERSASERDAHPVSEALVRGFVVDAVLSSPLAASVIPDGAAGVCTDPEDGSFALRLASETAVRFSATGYEDRTIQLAPADAAEMQTVELEPLRVATIRVTRADGRPAVDLPVHWSAARAASGIAPGDERWRYAATAVTSGRIEGRTDDGGVVELRLGAPVIAVVEDPSLPFERTVRVRPGEEVVVVLPECLQTIRFVRGRDGPAFDGLEVLLWSPTAIGARVERRTTDVNGEIAVAPAALPLLVRLRDDVVMQFLLRCAAGAATELRTDTGACAQVRLGTTSYTETVVIAVEPGAGALRLVDAHTDAPVCGPVTIDYHNPTPGRYPDGAPMRVRDILGPRHEDRHVHKLEPRDGIVQIPWWLARSAEELAELEGLDVELVVVAAGYRPRRLSDLAAVVLPGDEPATVRLEPAPQRHLRVRYADGGRPGPTSVRVVAPEERLVVYFSFGRVDGLHGPFDWPGGELEVTVEEREPLLLPASRLEREEVLDITLPGSTGAIEITDIPAGAAGLPLEARLGLGYPGRRFLPSERDLDSCRFADLPSGTYTVGPSGVPWQEHWGSAHEIEGVVRILGERELRPALFPIWTTKALVSIDELTAPRIGLSRRHAELALDGAGRYRIPAWTPVPELVAVCLGSETRWDSVQGLVVLDTLRPGESLTLETATVELRWAGSAPADGVKVTFEIEPQRMSNPVFWYPQRMERRWYPGETLVLEGVPPYVRELEVHDRRLAVELEPGTRSVYEVDLETLPRR